MKSFKQFLSEAREAPLYHATFARHAENILATNRLVGSEQDQGTTRDLGKVIFVTRSLKAAEHLYGDQNKVIFVLDQRRLSNNYKIRPVKNWTKYRDNITNRHHMPMYLSLAIGGNEFEEVIQTNAVTNISDYIIKIMVTPDVDLARYPHLQNDDRVVQI